MYHRETLSDWGLMMVMMRYYVIWKNNIDFIWAFAELVFSDC